MRLALCLALVIGCGSAAQRSAPPAATGVKQWIAVLRSDDPQQAYRHLAAKARKALPYEEFALLWKQSSPEREDQAQSLEEGLKGNPDLDERSKVVYADGRPVHLLREGGEWKLESALVSRHHAGHPHDAIKLFAEGLAGRSYEDVMRLLTTRRRQAIGRLVDDFATSLIRHIDDEIVFEGKHKAVLRWSDQGKRYRVELHKEGEEWRIDDIHERPEPASKPAPPE